MTKTKDGNHNQAPNIFTNVCIIRIHIPQAHEIKILDYYSFLRNTTRNNIKLETHTSMRQLCEGIPCFCISYTPFNGATVSNVMKYSIECMIWFLL